MPNYDDFLNVDDFWTRKDFFKSDRWGVWFYCKECEEIVETSRTHSKKYIFVCKKCWSSNISIWTLEGLRSNYNVTN